LNETGQMLIKISKRSRKHGLGIYGISQRPADVKIEELGHRRLLLAEVDRRQWLPTRGVESLAAVYVLPRNKDSRREQYDNSRACTDVTLTDYLES